MHIGKEGRERGKEVGRERERERKKTERKEEEEEEDHRVQDSDRFEFLPTAMGVNGQNSLAPFRVCVHLRHGLGPDCH